MWSPLSILSTNALKDNPYAHFIFNVKASGPAAFTEYILFVYFKEKLQKTYQKRLMPWSAQSFDYI